MKVNKEKIKERKKIYSKKYNKHQIEKKQEQLGIGNSVDYNMKICPHYMSNTLMLQIAKNVI